MCAKFEDIPINSTAKYFALNPVCTRLRYSFTYVPLNDKSQGNISRAFLVLTDKYYMRALE